MNAFVTVQSMAETEDVLGQPTGSWSTLAQVWASIKHMNGIEHIRSGAESSTVRASIKLRKRSDLTAKHRVLHGGRVYDVEAVLPDVEDRKFMFLSCKVTA